MEIKHEEKDGKGLFYIENYYEKIAKLSYERTKDGNIVAKHTWVSPALEGQGVAHKLFDKLIGLVRHDNAKLSSDCNYVKGKVEEKKENYADIWTQK